MADLKALIRQGEGISVEFKECGSALNRDVYKTVCAFLNRHGGTLLLGVSDAGEVTGVDPDCVEQIKKEGLLPIEWVEFKLVSTKSPLFTGTSKA